MASISVLVADDHPVYCAGLLSTLNAEPDITVVGEVIDGPDLLRKATELRPQVIIMEILMVSEGFDLVAKIRTELPDIRIVILTNSLREDHIFQAIDSGCYGYLQKTSSHAEIVQAARMAAAGEVMLSSRVVSELVKKLCGRSAGPKLSARESEVLRLISDGLTDTQISNSLSLGVSTIRTYVRRIIEKCGVKNRAEAAALYASTYQSSFERIAQGMRELNIAASQLQRDHSSLAKSFQDSESRYRRHFENIADIVVVFDERMRILDVSPSVEKVLGYAPNDLVGGTVWEIEIITRESLERLVSNFQRFLAGKATYPMVYEFIHKDGSYRWGEVRSAPIAEEGRKTTYISVIRDVTDRIAAQRCSQESERKLQMILANVDEYICLYDTEGVCVDANNYDRPSPLGYTREEVIGTRLSFFDAETEDDGQTIQRWHQQLMERAECQTPMRFTGNHRDGSQRFFEAGVKVIHDADKKIQGAVYIVRDVTERRRRESEVAELYRRLEAKNRELENMVGELTTERAFKRELLETMKDGILALDMEGFIIDLNTAFLEMVECTREECIGMPVTEMARTVLSQSSAEIASNLLKQVLSDKKLPAQKVPITIKNGRHKLLWITGDVAFNDRGKPKMVIASFRDVTDNQ